MNRIRFASKKLKAIDCGSDSIIYQGLESVIIELGYSVNDLVIIVEGNAFKIIIRRLSEIIDEILTEREQKVSDWFLRYPSEVRQKRRKLKEERADEVQYKNHHLKLILDIDNEREILTGIQLLDLFEKSSKIYIFNLPAELEQGNLFAILVVLNNLKVAINLDSFVSVLKTKNVVYSNEELIDILKFFEQKQLIQKQGNTFFISDLGRILLNY